MLLLCGVLPEIEYVRSVEEGLLVLVVGEMLFSFGCSFLVYVRSEEVGG
jgi:hypothetical protein